MVSPLNTRDAMRPLLDDYRAGSHRHYAAGCGYKVAFTGEVARLAFVHEEHIGAADDLVECVALTVNPEVHGVEGDEIGALRHLV